MFRTLRVLNKGSSVASASVKSSATPSIQALLETIKAAEMREKNQRTVFALGLLVMAGMTATMGYNTEVIRTDLNEHIRSSEERISKLEDQLKKSK
ncbi:hypothetical protein HDU81_001333 [Chytriomyces hyalinus]|nr:hypothetical protein HDU81_001333 [Chytriomyces hyalinus]